MVSSQAESMNFLHNEQPLFLYEVGRFFYGYVFSQLPMKHNFSGSDAFFHINQAGEYSSRHGRMPASNKG